MTERSTDAPLEPPAISTELPSAVLGPVPSHAWTWLLPLFALVVAVLFVVRVFEGRGVTVSVLADDGYGVRAGDSVRYRGIDVGRVEEVRLQPDLTGVELGVRIDDAARNLARAGSRFWIVRPHVALDSVQGLETIVGARYLAVLPGEAGAERQREFVALAEPPVAERLDPNGLEIVLEAPTRLGLSPGAPLAYRGIQVGSVLSVGLASDASSVEVRSYVRPAYAELVRENSVFYEVGGVDVSLGLMGGLRLELESLRSLIVGGIAFATPSDPAPRATNGDRFALQPEAKEDWSAWRPALPVGVDGGNASAGMASLPRPVRVQKSWETSILRRDRSKSGWALVVAGGLLAPKELLTPVEDARAPGTRLSVEGREFGLENAFTWENEWLARAPVGLVSDAVWPSERVRAAEAPEACLFVADPARAAFAVSGARLIPDGPTWKVDPAVSLDAEWHGAAVVARADGAVIGLLVFLDGEARVATLAGLR